MLFPRQADSWHFDRLYRAGEIELELVPQGTLAERIRAAGAGIGAFFTPTAYGTKLAEGKETRRIGERDYVLEYPIHADYALIKADRADRWGNLTYRKTARNFGPIMAMAAKCTVVQVRETVELGEIDPEHVVTPGIFVHRIVRVPASLKGLRDEKSSTATAGARAARDIPEGAYVNLGIGLPTLVADFLPKGRDHPAQRERRAGHRAEAGARRGRRGLDQRRQGAGHAAHRRRYFHHADSFGMIRGRHLDFAVLGAFQVSVSGDLELAHRRARRDSCGRRRDGPRGRGEEGARDDGAPRRTARARSSSAAPISTRAASTASTPI